MGIVDRILEYIDFKGITKYRFYQDTGLSNGFLDKKGNIGSDKCEKIITCYPDLNLEWLMMGIGEMIKPTGGASPLKSEDSGSCCSDLKDDIARYKRIIDEQSDTIRELKAQIVSGAPTVQGQKRKAG